MPPSPQEAVEIFDRGTQFSEEVIDTMKSFSIQPKRTGFRSPWQDGVAERRARKCTLGKARFPRQKAWRPLREHESPHQEIQDNLMTCDMRYTLMRPMDAISFRL
jgi:hypothetical protein